MSDASETTARRKNRMIYANKVIQQTAFDNDLKNYIIRQGAPQGKRAGDFSAYYYPATDGAIETTEEEQAIYIASVPNQNDILTENTLIFSSVGTFSWTAPARTTLVSFLLVGGGGGSGGGYDTGGGAGGGGGSVIVDSIVVTPGATYTIVVGDGGVGGISNRLALPEIPGSEGGNSSFDTRTALGGGVGFPSRQPAGFVNGNGGTAATNLSASSGGNGGGSNGGGGGGGGSSGAGSNKSGATGGSGGAGTANDFSGSVVTYGAGGRGGNGSMNYVAVAGAANTGNGASGGGGASGADENGAKGGSGLVIIRYQA